MSVKVIAGIVGALMLFAYVVPVVVKLKEFALSGVVLIGLALMLVDLWHSLRSKED